ncbi:DEAD/DEAH box helicase [Sphingomonas sp. PL20]|uniref:DEAD/DEAH box helicase n=1 Tax=Sphingomonas sp. PL20 TaxID=2760712 RepID=UPI001AE948D8
METPDELRAFLTVATADGVWNRLLYRGAAWALMREDGVLPDGAPPLGATIDTDLAEHGFSVLRAALSLRDATGASDLTSRGFERAANAFESLVRNGDPDAADRGFRRTIAAAAYHLAGFSAVAYSLFNEQEENRNAAPAETAIMLLVLRDLDRLRAFVREWLIDDDHSDATVSFSLDLELFDQDEAIVVILNTTVCRALAFFDFALQTGEASLLESARDLLNGAVSLANNAENVPLWWISKLCLSLIDDLWAHSLHVNLPLTPPDGGAEKYPQLRQMFIGSLYARKNAEVELWPSQRQAAKRSADVSDDLVVSLPTSAGKTRVAEIAALMALSSGQRVLIVTPLRALSAQTERSFRKTFAPLGFSVSSLYGASGISAGDEDALRTRDIVIATPEKLDFALRNDPGIIDDVGLIVLDEGHMIGPSEREIRYETLVQRLLRRSDADNRRIVCLSAILPGGEELDDLTAWIRSDEPGDPVRSEWRPTRQRYGALRWQSRAARLTFDLDQNGPFIDRFVEAVPAKGREKLPYPRLNSQLTLFAAWKFASQGKKVLIFSTQANWVEGYGKKVVDLCKRGYLTSLLDDEASIAPALEVGCEWLGDAHPAVVCLKAGVAVHHGRLPNPFLRELETLLSQNVLKVIIASPTLSQGLNLNAAVLLVPVLYRSGTLVTGEEFANVAGRAGRAFVDVEGLIVHSMFDKLDWRHRMWRKLVESIKARTLKSGLIQIVAEIISRLASEGVLEREDAFEYLANARAAWTSAAEEAAIAAAVVIEDPDEPEDDDADDEEAADDDDDEEKIEEEPLSQLIERLDATVFGLIEALDADQADLPRLLDEALKGSLWARQIEREGEGKKALHQLILQARANLIWKSTTERARRGHFAMGVGLEAGLAIDTMARDLNALIDRADAAALPGEIDELAESLTGLAERLLTIRPFIPDTKNPLPANWRTLLKQWISGTDVTVIGAHNMRVVEDAFTYRLVWALEAVRTRRVSRGWSPDIVAGGGAATLETGVPQLMMAMLIRAGLPSRRAAMAAVRDGAAEFVSPAEMREWLASDEIAAFTDLGEWPTAETAALWQRFRIEILSGGAQKWTVGSFTRRFDVPAGSRHPKPGLYRVETDPGDEGKTWLTTPDYRRLVPFRKSLSDPKPSLIVAEVSKTDELAVASRIGRGKAIWPPANAS